MVPPQPTAPDNFQHIPFPATIPASIPTHAGELCEALWRTLAYADWFDQAMSAADIIRYLDVATDADEVMRQLMKHTNAHWTEQDGLYCLPGRQSIVALTRQRQRAAKAHWLRARLWAKAMAHLPFVRMISVTGSLAMDNMRPGADIDYLVVSKRGRVWLARLGLVAMVRLARLVGDELCPNYVLSTEALSIRDHTFFNARELAQMVPLFGMDIYQRMMQLNGWLHTYIPAAHGLPRAVTEIKLTWLERQIKSLVEWALRGSLGDALERWERKRKIARLSRLPGADSPNVILSEEQCKGHFRNGVRSV